MRHPVIRWKKTIAAIGIAALVAGLEKAEPTSAATIDENAATLAKKKPEKNPPIVFSADDVVNDDKLDIVIAKGNVEISQSGRTLLADVVTYNKKTDTVIAAGNVSIIEDATGETSSASYLELTDKMKEGFIRDFRSLMSDRSRLAANTGLRTNGTRTELRKGVYSPCDLCADDPSQPPLWQIKAARIVRDLDAKTVTYHSATLEIGGFPILWTPYLSHPDPSVKRQSGFMPPTIGDNTLLGVFAETPYYWAIAPDVDLTISPLFTAREGSLLGGEYRERFSDGEVSIRGTVTESDPNPSTTATAGAGHEAQLRGDIFGTGIFSINENLRAGFDVQRVSDLIYMPEYKIGNITNYLTSKAYLEDFSGRDYGSIFAYDFQSTQIGVTTRSQPVILPVANYNLSFRPTSWGAQFSGTASFLDLLRETGSASRRLSLGTQMNLPFTIANGQRFNAYASVRGDAYYISALPTSSGALSENTVERVFPQIGLEWRDPWIRRGATSTWLVEPIAAVYAAPIGGNSQKIPDNDSMGVDFSDTDLFVPNRFIGYDRVDGGQRVDYGVHGNWRSDTSPAVDFLVGQSNRFQHDSAFTRNGTGDGLDRQTSDYVGHVSFSPGPYLTVAYHFRYDQEDFRAERQELATTFGPSSVRVNFSYAQLGPNLHDSETARQQIGGGITVIADDYWTASFSGIRDIQGDGHLVQINAAIRYSDECTTFIASVARDGYTIGNFQPGTTILFELVLKNLGELAAPSISTGSSTE